MKEEFLPQNLNWHEIPYEELLERNRELNNRVACLAIGLVCVGALCIGLTAIIFSSALK